MVAKHWIAYRPVDRPCPTRRRRLRDPHGTGYRVTDENSTPFSRYRRKSALTTPLALAPRCAPELQLNSASGRCLRHGPSYDFDGRRSTYTGCFEKTKKKTVGGEVSGCGRVFVSVRKQKNGKRTRFFAQVFANLGVYPAVLSRGELRHEYEDHRNHTQHKRVPTPRKLSNVLRRS